MKTSKKHQPHPVVERIRKIMRDRGLKQAAIAEYAGVDPSQMYKVLKGDVQISLWQLSNLASGLGMELIDLFTYPEKYVPENASRDEVSAMITIQLNREKKEKVLRAVFGEKDLKILNIK